MMMSSAFSIFPPIFYLFIFLSSASHHPPSFSSLPQPPLTQPIKQPACCGASPLNRLVLCASSPSSCAPPPTNYPYAGWNITPSPAFTVVQALKESQEKCSDRSRKCVGFTQLCREALYHLFLRSHCALTCGYCGNVTAISRGNGGKTNETAGKPTTMAIKTAESTEKTVRTATETLSDRSGTGQIGEKAGTTPSGRATESEDKCEDVGRNCAAMERMCGNIARRDIMATFCRKTCNLC
uniref:ShKT domain-containing protein n=1 Tax=Globodera rostochiensis TaxID=31243 RepID=A0A914HG80_GLORO